MLPPRRSARCWDDSGKTAHTTHLHHSAEYVKITRPHHPFEGKSLAVFGSRRQQGRLHLILVLPDGSRSLIPAEWTDVHGCATPPTCNTGVASVEDLLRSRRVVDALQRRLATNVGETHNFNVESACANQTELHGRCCDPADIDVGSIGRGTETRRH